MKYQTLLIIHKHRAKILSHDTIEEAEAVVENMCSQTPSVGTATPLNYKLHPKQIDKRGFYLDVGHMSEEDAQNAVLNIKAYIEDSRVCESKNGIDLYVLNDFIIKNAPEGKE